MKNTGYMATLALVLAAAASLNAQEAARTQARTDTMTLTGCVQGPTGAGGTTTSAGGGAVYTLITNSLRVPAATAPSERGAEPRRDGGNLAPGATTPGGGAAGGGATGGNPGTANSGQPAAGGVVGSGATGGNPGSADSAHTSVAGEVSYVLDGNDVAKHVGHQVQVTGKLATAGSTGGTASGSPGGTAGSTGARGAAQTLKVSSIRMLADTCSR